MNNQAMLAMIGLGLVLIGNLVALIWAASKLFTTVRFMDNVLSTVVQQQKSISRDLSDIEGRLRVVENRIEIR